MVPLAALLVKIEGEMLLANASIANSFLERAYARERARSLARQLSLGPLLRHTPLISEPEESLSAEEGYQVTLFDVVKTFGKILEKAEKLASERAKAVPD